jgi:hypothetical protein
MAECQNCGSHVSKRFARVMGDNNGKIHACPSCSLNSVGPKAGGAGEDDV